MYVLWPKAGVTDNTIAAFIITHAILAGFLNYNYSIVYRSTSSTASIAPLGCGKGVENLGLGVGGSVEGSDPKAQNQSLTQLAKVAANSSVPQHMRRTWSVLQGRTSRKNVSS